MENKWNAEHYDDKLAFVSEFGKGIVSLLQPKTGENILDLGCGTGDLSNEIAAYGVSVVGIDLSELLIRQVQSKYPNLLFEVEGGIALCNKWSYKIVHLI
ncbi:MAG: class I SAM-dependent methyltransferase [Acidibacillus sp.]|uniref:Methyltransferase domain-containing protein n=1 Tax=Sulfoacidibacillus ferrooxidans TaxID=2005001 RepID=A0A9X1V8U2_9BACL|nr:hypothetical protein [Sulfoacidibacillus ferrooxidans]MCY0892625.1 class I SAM-dependent methyltransferase [Acidibacillus sp.]